MRLLISIIACALLLGGCELFKPVKKSSSVDIKGICEDFCDRWVHATYDCYNISGDCPAGLPPEDDMRDECKDECVDISNDLDEEGFDEAVQCMECANDELDDDAECLDVYEDMWDFYLYVPACEYECAPVESMLNKFDWYDDLDDICWNV
jgi:hypothetical protein